MVDLSIIVPSWNAKKYLQKCIESIISETRNFKTEIIVVDNASSDGSQELVREKYPDVTLICNSENFGFAKANNIGIRRSSGNYICLINSDVEVLRGCFDTMVTYMKHQPRIGILGPQILNKDRNIQRSCIGLQTLWNTFCRAIALDALFPDSKLFGSYLMSYWKHDTIRDVDVINGCFWMVRREALDQVGLLDERFFIYAEDKDWCKRFWDAGWKVVFYPEAQAIHYGGVSASNAPIKFYVELYRAESQYWKKHHGRLSYIIYSHLSWLHHCVRLIGEAVLYVIKPLKRFDSRYKMKRSLAYIRWQLGLNFLPEGE